MIDGFLRQKASDGERFRCWEPGQLIIKLPEIWDAMAIMCNTCIVARLRDSNSQKICDPAVLAKRQSLRLVFSH